MCSYFVVCDEPHLNDLQTDESLMVFRALMPNSALKSSDRSAQIMPRGEGSDIIRQPPEMDSQQVNRSDQAVDQPLHGLKGNNPGFQ
jgi:hypothetical protein